MLDNPHLLLGLWILVEAACYLYPRYEGIREGHYYEEKLDAGDIENDHGEHSLFTRQRTCFYLLMIVLVAVMSDSWLTLSINSVSNIILFPFVHDYHYYRQRNRLHAGLYELGVNNQSTTSKALSDRLKINTPQTRLTLAVLGAVGTLIVFTIKIYTL